MNYSAKIFLTVSALWLAPLAAYAVPGDAPVRLANEGLSETKSAGLVPGANECLSATSKDISGVEDPILVAASDRFCINPVGYVCGNVKDRIAVQKRLR